MNAAARRLMAFSCLRRGLIAEARTALDQAWEAYSEAPDNLENGRLLALEMELAKAENNREKFDEFQIASTQVFTKLGAKRDLVLLEAVEF